MLEQPFAQLLILLLAAVAVVAVFQRLRIPWSLGYLLVGVVLGPYTPGPIIEGHQLRVLAEFGIVFLLFTIGLSFSLPQIRALRDQVFALGTGQVALTTSTVGIVAWLAGLSPAAAFVVGAVFAPSSTTIISRQLTEQGDDNSRHGRLGTALSVFQDVTAVPFVVVIPALGFAVVVGRSAELFALSVAGLAGRGLDHRAARLLLISHHDTAAIGRLLRELDLPGVSVAALVRDGRRHPEPSGDLLLEAGDMLVLFGTDLDVHKAEERLLE